MVNGAYQGGWSSFWLAWNPSESAQCRVGERGVSLAGAPSTGVSEAELPRCGSEPQMLPESHGQWSAGGRSDPGQVAPMLNLFLVVFLLTHGLLPSTPPPRPGLQRTPVHTFWNGIL